jgi:hypothetical protein
VTIEFLYWEGCPSHPEAKALLEDEHRGVDAQVNVRKVRTHD